MTTTEDILTFFKPYNITIYETLTEKNNISSISVSGGICEITTATSHTAIVGQYVYITLGKNAGYHEITAVSSTTIRYLDDSGVASGAIGEVYIYSINEHMINDAIQSAKDNIEAITQIPIGRVDELSTYHDGTNTEELFLNHRGIRELISIQIIQGMILNYIIDISSVFLIAEEGVLRIKQLTSVSIGTIRAVFPQGRRNIKVTFRIGYELDELHNVKIVTPANNNVLAYTSATDIWENKTVDTILGGTPVTGGGLTNQIAYFPSNGSEISGLDLGTYPTPTELANVKGVTSPIQTQLDLKQYTLLSVVGNFSMADASTYFFSPLGGTGGTLFTASTNLDFSSASANVLNRIYLHVVNGGGAAGTSENSSLYFRNITTATSTLIGTFQTNASTFLKFDFTSININIPANNLWCIEIRTPTWATNPTSQSFRITSFLTQ